MKLWTDRVIMDCTHSVQRPGAAGGKAGGDRLVLNVSNIMSAQPKMVQPETTITEI